MTDETTINRQHILSWLRQLADVYNNNSNYLTQLDSPIGDADHGTNMTRGFQAVVDKLDSWQDALPKEIFRQVGMTLVSTVGGSSGPLYGTLFLKFGEAVGDDDTIDAARLVTMMHAAVDGIIQRGHAELGDKTMVDALRPALDAMKAAQSEGKTLPEILEAAETAAKDGMEATKPLQARKGRASYLGERSIGHQDPGATSAYFLVRAMLDAWQSDET